MTSGAEAWRGPRGRKAAVSGLLLIHAALLLWNGYHSSPVADEPAHLAAGVAFLHDGLFDVYRVNPPLVRMIAALPVLALQPTIEWSSYTTGLTARPEWDMGDEFVVANPTTWPRYFIVARWVLIPVILSGAFCCYCWARELYGTASGFLALILWCFSPNILAWGATIIPDACATACGVVAGYAFWGWLRRGTWSDTIYAGIGMGLAELTKATWVILFVLWPVMFAMWQSAARRTESQVQLRVKILQLCVIVVLALYLLNAAYGFEGSFIRLGDYTFVSRFFAGKDAIADGALGGNRFAQSWIGALPVPVPHAYATGIDIQKSDFDAGMWSYLNGQWSESGWWYYYMYAFLLKAPLGTWALVLIGLAVTIGARSHYSGRWRDELLLIAPVVVVMALVSWQAPFARYLRYALPCLPFVFIWTSKLARCIQLNHRWLIWLSGIAVLQSVTSSLGVYPHSMSYFNEIAQGPRGGHRYLIDANIDWGQDIWYFRKWLRKNMRTDPVYCHLNAYVRLTLFDIETRAVPESVEPGWYAMSIDRLHARDGRYEQLLRHMKPRKIIGYSIYVYYLSHEDVTRLRGEEQAKDSEVPNAT